MSATHVLVVDDDVAMRQMIKDYLSGHFMLVSAVSDGTEMLRALRAHPVDLIILDLQLAREDGLDLLRNLGGLTDAPIIIITGHRGEEVDKVIGLELGADDYIVKPFGLRELLARIRVVLRRAEATERRSRNRPVHIRYRFAGWELDMRTRQLTTPQGEALRLTPGELNLLTAFLRSPQQILSREQLLSASRVHEQEVYDRSIDVLILRLRRKLERDPSLPALIQTERGVGYIFTEPVDTQRDTIRFSTPAPRPAESPERLPFLAPNATPPSGN
jgi:DNA-binding response OmpR family regulator